MFSIFNYLFHPYNIVVACNKGIVSRFIPDKLLIKCLFRQKMGSWPDLNHPKSFNEKLQWLKLHDRDPHYSRMVDKYEVKNYVASKIGNKYIIPTIGIWERFEEIDFDELPDQFVLKCTHDSGSVVICKDKKVFDAEKAKRKLNRCLNRNFYYVSREWSYKNVKPRIIAEPYLSAIDDSTNDYKMHSFNGVPKVILLCRDQFGKEGMFEDFDSEKWEHYDVRRPNAKNGVKHEMPNNLEEMLTIAKRLSEDMPFARTDFYIVNDKLFFGEIAFYPASRMERFIPEKFDYMLGDWIEIDSAGGLLLRKDNAFLLINAQELDMIDYKIMCFNGKAKCLFTCTERFSDDGLKVTFFDTEWNEMPFTRHYPKSQKRIDRPRNLELMIKLSEELADGIPFVRVDLYCKGEDIYFGEMTFYPGSGVEEFHPELWDCKLGDWINLI